VISDFTLLIIFILIPTVFSVVWSVILFKIYLTIERIEYASKTVTYVQTYTPPPQPPPNDDYQFPKIWCGPSPNTPSMGGGLCDLAGAAAETASISSN